MAPFWGVLESPWSGDGFSVLPSHPVGGLTLAGLIPAPRSPSPRRAQVGRQRGPENMHPPRASRPPPAGVGPWPLNRAHSWCQGSGDGNTLPSRGCQNSSGALRPEAGGETRTWNVKAAAAPLGALGAGVRPGLTPGPPEPWVGPGPTQALTGAHCSLGKSLLNKYMDGRGVGFENERVLPAQLPNSSLGRDPARAKSPFEVAGKAGAGDRGSNLWALGRCRQEWWDGARAGGSLCVNR